MVFIGWRSEPHIGWLWLEALYFRNKMPGCNEHHVEQFDYPFFSLWTGGRTYYRTPRLCRTCEQEKFGAVIIKTSSFKSRAGTMTKKK